MKCEETLWASVETTWPLLDLLWRMDGTHSGKLQGLLEDCLAAIGKDNDPQDRSPPANIAILHAMGSALNLHDPEFDSGAACLAFFMNIFTDHAWNIRSESCVICLAKKMHHSLWVFE